MRKPDNASSKILYSCIGADKKLTSTTFDRSECPSGSDPVRLGFVAMTPDFAAPAVLYRCIDRTSDNVLLTDDEAECAKQDYASPEKIGYVAAAGRLSQQRISILCEELNKQCSADENSAACIQTKAFCAE